MDKLAWTAALLAAACGSSNATHPQPGPGGTGGMSGPPGTGGAPGTGGGATGGTGGPADAAGEGPAPAADAGMTPYDAAGPDAAGPSCQALLGGGGPPSEWVHWDDGGKLVYKPLDARGDRIMDFSYAGYHGGGVRLPEVPVKAMVMPSGGDDDTAAIQGAIDAVSQRPPEGGFRGAVLLAAGTFKSATTVTITASGVVLRGSGSGTGGTEIQLTGLPHRFLILQGSGTRTVGASPTTITDDYVPAGSRTFSVASAAGFAVGDEVLVGRPVTAEWVHFMGMDLLVRNGAAQTWIKPGTVVESERVITAIDGTRITVDIPLSDSLDAAHVRPPGGSLAKFTYPRTSEVGVEHLRVVGQPRSETVDFNFLAMNTVVDAWVRDVVAHDVTAGVTTDGNAKRITIEDTTISHTMVDFVSPAKPSDFNIDAAQVLIQRSASKGSNRSFSMVTESQVPGPTVVLDFTVTGISPPLQPHQRWSTGLLVDRAAMEAGSIDFIDRNILGSGHGWTMGWAVAWNSTAPSFHVELPPGTMNWAIGCKGTVGAPAAGHQSGTFESQGAPVNIKSLYLAQLCERLGPQALADTGY